LVPLGRLPAAEEVDVDEEEVAEPLPAVMAEGVDTEVMTTVTGAREPPSDALWVTTEVTSRVEGGCEEADTMDVTTLVLDGSTVTVLGILDVDEKTADDTDDAMADEKDDWAACSDERLAEVDSGVAAVACQRQSRTKSLVA
jgi:hypothetical protein